MNEKEINLVEILKNVPKGTKFYCTPYGDVEFNGVSEEKDYPILFLCTSANGDECELNVTSKGKIYEYFNGECVFFPSRDNRDWSTYKYTPPQLKEEFKPYDRVLVRNDNNEWEPQFFSHISHYNKSYPYGTMDGCVYMYCIPYEGNEHLIFTKAMPKGGEE